MLLRSLFRRQGWHAAQGQEGPSRRGNAPPRHAKPRARFAASPAATPDDPTGLFAPLDASGPGAV
jgi:hypothetical protein